MKTFGIFYWNDKSIYYVENKILHYDRFERTYEFVDTLPENISKISIRERNTKADILAEIMSYYKSHNQSRYTYKEIEYTHKPYDWNNRKDGDLISFYLYYPEEDCYRVPKNYKLFPTTYRVYGNCLLSLDRNSNDAQPKDNTILTVLRENGREHLRQLEFTTFIKSLLHQIVDIEGNAARESEKQLETKKSTKELLSIVESLESKVNFNFIGAFPRLEIYNCFIEENLTEEEYQKIKFIFSKCKYDSFRQEFQIIEQAKTFSEYIKLRLLVRYFEGKERAKRRRSEDALRWKEVERNKGRIQLRNRLMDLNKRWRHIDTDLKYKSHWTSINLDIKSIYARMSYIKTVKANQLEFGFKLNSIFLQFAWEELSSNNFFF